MRCLYQSLIVDSLLKASPYGAGNGLSLWGTVNLLIYLWHWRFCQDSHASLACWLHATSQLVLRNLFCKVSGLPSVVIAECHIGWMRWTCNGCWWGALQKDREFKPRLCLEIPQPVALIYHNLTGEKEPSDFHPSYLFRYAPEWIKLYLIAFVLQDLDTRGVNGTSPSNRCSLFIKLRS